MADDDLMPLVPLAKKTPGKTSDPAGSSDGGVLCIVPLLRASLLEFSPVVGTTGGGAEVAVASILRVAGLRVRDLQQLAAGRWWLACSRSSSGALAAL